MNLDEELKQAMKPLLADMAVFLNYTRKNPDLPLTKSQLQLKAKDLAALNEKMQYRERLVTTKSPQTRYQLINLLFHVARAGELTRAVPTDTEVVLQPIPERIESYEQLNDYEKYFLLLDCFWLRMPWTRIENTGVIEATLGSVITRLLSLQSKPAETWLPLDREAGVPAAPNTVRLEPYSEFAYIFHFFGFYEMQHDETVKKFDKYKIPVKAIRISALGKMLMDTLLANFIPQRDHLYSRIRRQVRQWDELVAIFRIKGKPTFVSPPENSVPFLEPFKPHFSAGLFSRTLPGKDTTFLPGVYTLRIELWEQLYCVIRMDATHFFEHLNYAIHTIFKLREADKYFFQIEPFVIESVIFDPAKFEFPISPALHTDEVRIGDVHLEEGQLFSYFHNDKQNFMIGVEKIEKNVPSIKNIELVQKPQKV